MTLRRRGVLGAAMQGRRAPNSSAIGQRGRRSAPPRACDGTRVIRFSSSLTAHLGACRRSPGSPLLPREGHRRRPTASRSTWRRGEADHSRPPNSAAVPPGFRRDAAPVLMPTAGGAAALSPHGRTVADICLLVASRGWVPSRRRSATFGSPAPTRADHTPAVRARPRPDLRLQAYAPRSPAGLEKTTARSPAKSPPTFTPSGETMLKHSPRAGLGQRPGGASLLHGEARDGASRGRDVPEMALRWLSVGVHGQRKSPSREAVPGPPVSKRTPRPDPAPGRARGRLFFTTDDVQAATRAEGAASVQQEPTEQPYGVDAGFRDPSGNQFRMAQAR